MSDVVFDKGYEELRKLYVQYLAEYPISFLKLKYHGIKNLLLKAILLRAETITGGYRLFYDKKDLIRSLVGDMLSLRLKSMVHRVDSIIISSVPDVSANWDIVTNYYAFFFSALFLLRMMHRGTVFLDSSEKHEVEKTISNSLGSMVAVESNLSFKIDLKNEYIELKKTEGNVHESVWQEVGKLIEEMIPLSNPRSKERTLLTLLFMINKKKRPTYPSQLRNLVNYRTESVIDYLNNGFHKASFISDYIQYIEKYNYEEDEPLDKTINIYLAYRHYIIDLGDSYFNDYMEMLGSKRFLMHYPKILFCV